MTTVTATKLVLVSAACLAACNTPVDRKLPSAQVATTSGTSAAAMPSPHLAKSHAAASAVACGDDIALNGDASPDIRYLYTYDELGRLAGATGAYTAGGKADTVDYTYDHLDHMTHSLETRGWGSTRVELTSDYDTLGDLLDYTTDEVAFEYHDHIEYAMSSFDAGGQPAVEVITELAQPPLTYQLGYDALDRLAFVALDGGGTTTYTYDDDARTTTIDTGNGAFHGVIEFDEQNRELSEVWGGTDPAAITSEDLYDYDGDRLLGATYTSGTTAAPKQAMTDEVDTLRYDCTATSY